MECWHECCKSCFFLFFFLLLFILAQFESPLFWFGWVWRWSIEADQLSEIRANCQLTNLELALSLIKLINVFHEIVINNQKVNSCTMLSKNFQKSYLKVVKK